MIFTADYTFIHIGRFLLNVDKIIVFIDCFAKKKRK